MSKGTRSLEILQRHKLQASGFCDNTKKDVEQVLQCLAVSAAVSIAIEHDAKVTPRHMRRYQA